MTLGVFSLISTTDIQLLTTVFRQLHKGVMEPFQDLYKIFNVSCEASYDEIKAKYHRLLLKVKVYNGGLGISHNSI